VITSHLWLAGLLRHSPPILVREPISSLTTGLACQCVVGLAPPALFPSLGAHRFPTLRPCLVAPFTILSYIARIYSRTQNELTAVLSIF